MLVLFAPFVEEAIFRLLPIAVISALAVANRRDAICAVVIVICGIIFGLGHGHPMNVLLQGVGGIGLGLLFLANRPSNVAAYFSCVLAHSMLNFSIMMLR
jgi:membrane protease YdiL (CAAX protease family)